MFNGKYTAILITKEVVKNNALYLIVSVFSSIKLLKFASLETRKKMGRVFFGNNFRDCL